MCSLRKFSVIIILISLINLYDAIEILNVEYVNEDDTGIRHYWVPDSSNASDVEVMLDNSRIYYDDIAVQFDNTRFNELPDNIFKVFPNLTAAFLLYCDVKLLRQSNFPEGIELKELDLSHNHIDVLPNNVFSHLVKLSRLVLSHNRLTSLNASVFKGLTDLTDLYLNDNKIREISPHAFKPLVNLEILDLEGNEIEIIAEDLFTTNENITQLYLGKNNIKEVGPNSFYYLQRLITLEIHGANLEYLYLPSLKSLHAARSSLRNLYVGGTVYNLNVEYNQLDKINVADLQATNVINAKYNRITNITNLSEARNITLLDLSGNPLDSLPSGIFDEMIALRSLDLSFTNLTSLDDVNIFKKLDSILHLHLNGNSLTTLDKDLFVLQQHHEFHVYLNSNVCDLIDLESFRSTDARIICIT